jgi:S-adenosylmethionine/arginine decarboxylase-like enzyme
MKLLHGPIVRYVSVPGNMGATGIAIIETSHVAIHVWDEQYPALVQLDVYTCGSLDPQDVFKWLEKFKPTKVEYKFLDREHELKELANG